MTVQDILNDLFSGKPLVYMTEGRKAQPMNRVTKAKGLAARQKIDWQTVRDAMTDEQRKAVDDAG